MRDQVLDMANVGVCIGRRDAAAARREHALTKTGRREEEHQAAHETQVRQQRVHLAQRALADSPLDDALHRGQDTDRLASHTGLEVLAARQHLAEHHRADVRATARRHLGHVGHDLPEQIRSRPRGIGEPLDARHDLAERVLHDGAVEIALATEVVADHRLVGAGLRRDGPHGHTVVPALGEQLGGGRQQRLARGAGVPPPSRAGRLAARPTPAVTCVHMTIS